MNHIVFVMDGNRRWARKKGWRAMYGHKEGVESVKRVVQFCLEKQIPHVSLYTFSLENLKRPQEEKNYLFDLIAQQAEHGFDEFVTSGVRVRFVGDTQQFPPHIVPVIKRLEEKTAHCTKLQLNFLFCYGARQEILSGIKALVQKVKAGLLAEDQISDEILMEHMWTHGIPEPDLIVRTGGVKRLSNLLLFQAAYSEFHFLDWWRFLLDVSFLEACCFLDSANEIKRLTKRIRIRSVGIRFDWVHNVETEDS